MGMVKANDLLPKLQLVWMALEINSHESKEKTIKIECSTPKCPTNYRGNNSMSNFSTLLLLSQQYKILIKTEN